MSKPVTVRPAERERESIQSVAVVGAGMAGLACARALAAAGLDVCVFDKSRGPSGRLSTRRREAGQWDHGAPYFEARSEAFRAQCRAWARAGLVERWNDGHDRERWVGIPRMSAIGRRLVGALPLKTGIRVASVAQRDHQWCLTDTEAVEHGPFDAVVLAIPAPQAAALLSPFPAVQAAVASVVMHPVHALLVAFEHKTSAAKVLRPEDGPFELVVPNWIKPGRPATATWVAHTRPSWSGHDSRSRRPTWKRSCCRRFAMPPGCRPLQCGAWCIAGGLRMRRTKQGLKPCTGGIPGHVWESPETGVPGVGSRRRGAVEPRWQSGCRLRTAFRLHQSQLGHPSVRGHGLARLRPLRGHGSRRSGRCSLVVAWVVAWSLQGVPTWWPDPRPVPLHEGSRRSCSGSGGRSPAADLGRSPRPWPTSPGVSRGLAWVLAGRCCPSPGNPLNDGAVWGGQLGC